ncbi:MAG TPA: ABC transporter substrate-binding protein [Syntrophales bacterium]|nr:ABC transporter substrate-binding protein [Syntrophales bacterium]HOL60242.1 ABC transporter substrate-binding protein [Syntrophales bacterium]HPO34620.1 ABC transporter substrate-binding protein [Syntrophales bacterium]
MKGKIRRVILLTFLFALIGPPSVSLAGEIVIGYTGPLSGPAAEYGQDCLFGLDMAIRELNAAGGIEVKGTKYTFKLEKLDDRADPTQAVNNARRIRAAKGIAVFNGVFTTLAAMAKINEEPGNEFILMAYTSTPKVVQLGNKLLIGTTAPPFPAYIQVFVELAMKEEGWKKAAMLCTLGAYGEEWRHAFANYWKKKGGVITIDKPANYYIETDCSAPLTAVLATKPDTILIGGPSSTTALVIEQARSMGFKGGFILIDQAKMDYIADILKGYKLFGNTIGVAGATNMWTPILDSWVKNYRAAYKRRPTSESLRNYGAMIALSRAIVAAGTPTDVKAIRAAFPKIFPILGDKVPTELYGIQPHGRMMMAGAVQKVVQGELKPPVQYYHWIKSDKEWQEINKITKYKTERRWLKVDIENCE